MVDLAYVAEVSAVRYALSVLARCLRVRSISVWISRLRVYFMRFMRLPEFKAHDLEDTQAILPVVPRLDRGTLWHERQATNDLSDLVASSTAPWPHLRPDTAAAAEMGAYLGSGERGQAALERILHYSPGDALRLGRYVATALRCGSGDEPSSFKGVLGAITEYDAAHGQRLLATRFQSGQESDYVTQQSMAFRLQALLCAGHHGTIDPMADFADRALQARSSYGFLHASATVAWWQCINEEYDAAVTGLVAARQTAMRHWTTLGDHFNSLPRYETSAPQKSESDIHAALGFVCVLTAYACLAEDGASANSRLRQAGRHLAAARLFYRQGKPPWQHGVGLWRLAAAAYTLRADRSIKGRGVAIEMFREAGKAFGRCCDQDKSGQCDDLVALLRQGGEANGPDLLKAFFDVAPSAGHRNSAQVFVRGRSLRPAA